MLSGDEDVVHSERSQLSALVLVLNDNLGLAVWSQPGDGSVVSLDGHLFAELVGEVMGVGVQGLGVPLVGGVSKHKSLVASAKLSLIFVSMDGCRNVGILCMDVSDHLAVGTVKANLFASVADLTAHVASDLLEVNLVGGDVSLTKKDNLNIDR